jgi:branched-chain amino acid transport system substrate-binding protein
MNKRTMMAIAAVAALVVAGCSSAAGSSSSSGGSGDSVKIGFLGNLTGPAATLGVPVGNALKLAFDQANSGKAVPGVTFNLGVANTQSLPANAVTAFQGFAQDSDQVTFSDSLTPIALGVAPLASRDKIMFITGAGGNKFPTANGGAWTWQWSDLTDPVENVGTYLYKAGFRKVAVLEDEDNPAFLTMGANESAAFTAAGGTVVTVQKYHETDTSFSSVLTDIAAAKPDAIILSGIEQQCANIVRQIKQTPALSKVQISGVIGWDQALASIAGASAAGAIFPSYYFSGGSAADSAFASAYTAEFKSAPSASAAIAYEMAWLVVAAAQKVRAKGQPLTATNLRAEFPSAVSSPVLKSHALINGIQLTAAGGISYPGIILQYQPGGSLKLVS